MTGPRPSAIRRVSPFTLFCLPDPVGADTTTFSRPPKASNAASWKSSRGKGKIACGPRRARRENGSARDGERET
jgi:hypothetical protein